jgi:hypothetical protein
VRALDAASNVKHVLRGIETHRVGELEGRLAAANVKLTRPVQILGFEVIDVLPRVGKRRENCGPQVSPGVVLLDVFFQRADRCHGASCADTISQRASLMPRAERDVKPARVAGSEAHTRCQQAHRWAEPRFPAHVVCLSGLLHATATMPGNRKAKVK